MSEHIDVVRLETSGGLFTNRHILCAALAALQRKQAQIPGNNLCCV
jgi:hypothetical protein